MRTTIRTREASWAAVLAFAGAVLALGALTAHPALLGGAARALREASAGWLAPDLLTGTLHLAVIVGGVALLGARLRAADVGLTRTGWGAGALTLLGVGALFAALLLAGAAGPDALRVYPGLAPWGAPGLAGLALGALAMAAFTETAFRGFLFPQLYLKLGGDGAGGGALWGGILASSAIAAAWYAPALAFTHHKAGASFWLHLAGFAASGIFLCFFYLRTGNLYVVIAGHALISIASQGFAASGRTAGVMMMLGLGFVAAWPLLRGRRLLEPLAAVEGVGREVGGRADRATASA
jgi:membrane protease YdiL (CAAX protease family)